MSGAGTPIGAAEFATLMARLGPFAADRRVGVAVSGGADSLALAWLAAGWGKPVALVVDHGLRADSAGEARLTAERLTGFGVTVRLARLSGLGAGPGLAARARAARYDALEALCRESNLLDLLLGHHLADQAETVALREEDRSGPAGLAGMASLVETAGLRLLRPLLGAAPARLRATLDRAGLSWVEDPSNADRQTARGRLRAALAGDLARQERLLAQAGDAARERQAREQALATELAAWVSFRPEGFALVSAPLSPEAIAALHRAITGADYPPPRLALERLARRWRPATLGGMRLLDAGRAGPGFFALREEAACAPAIPATPGAVWDRRFRLTGAPPSGMTIGAVGRDAARLRRHSPLPAAILAVLPALRRNGTLASVPHCAYPAASRDPGAGFALVFSPAAPSAGAPFHS